MTGAEGRQDLAKCCPRSRRRQKSAEQMQKRPRNLARPQKAASPHACAGALRHCATDAKRVHGGHGQPVPAQQKMSACWAPTPQGNRLKLMRARGPRGGGVACPRLSIVKVCEPLKHEARRKIARAWTPKATSGYQEVSGNHTCSGSRKLRSALARSVSSRKAGCTDVCPNPCPRPHVTTTSTLRLNRRGIFQQENGNVPCCFPSENVGLWLFARRRRMEC